MISRNSASRKTVNCWSHTAAVIDRQPAIRPEWRFVPTPPAFDVRQNITVRFGTQKLEWFGYSTVKKIW